MAAQRRKPRIIVIVGQAPGPRSDPGEPLSGASGRRLAALCDVACADFLARFRRVNLLPRWPGAAGKGDLFPAERAHRAAFRIDLGNADLVILLGFAVARAFGVRRGYFQRAEVRGIAAVVAPHPSGISHWWNEPANVRRARRFWRRLARI
jgi:uracil-DNA glycosylase